MSCETKWDSFAGEKVGRDVMGGRDVPNGKFEHKFIFKTFDGRHKCAHKRVGGATTRQPSYDVSVVRVKYH